MISTLKLAACQALLGGAAVLFLFADLQAQIVPISQSRSVEVYDDTGDNIQTASDFNPFNVTIDAYRAGNYAGDASQNSTISANEIKAMGDAQGSDASNQSHFETTFLLSSPVNASITAAAGDQAQGVHHIADVSLTSPSGGSYLTNWQYSNTNESLTQSLTLPAGVYTLQAFAELFGTGSTGYQVDMTVSPIVAGGTNLPSALVSGGNSISAGTNEVGAIGGGTAAVGGGDVTLPDVTTAGVFSSLYFNIDSAAQFNAQLGVPAPSGVNFYLSPGQTVQMWDLHYTGDFTGSASVTLHYDPSLLGGVDPSQLQVWHFTEGAWVAVANEVIDPVNDTITFTTDSFSPFVLGVPEPGSLALAGIGGVGLLIAAARRQHTAVRRLVGLNNPLSSLTERAATAK